MTQTHLINATVATMQASDCYGLVKNAAIVIEDEKFLWVGPQDELDSCEQGGSAEQIDCRHRLVTPG